MAKLREIGIQPDILICRTEHPIPFDLRQKLSLFCNVPVKCVIEEQDVKHSIYELPLELAKENLDELVLAALRLDVPARNLSEWEDVVKRLLFPKYHITIGVVGKYIELQDAYKSVYESLTHAGIANETAVKIVKIDADGIEKDGSDAMLKGLDGILIPGGFGHRAIEGKILAAKYAREHKIPYFGLCLGMQILVIEFARNVAKIEDANSTEFEPNAKNPVIHLMEEQKHITQLGATMRLGSYPCRLEKDSLAYKAYDAEMIHERHRHRYEFNNAYRDQLVSCGLRIGGVNPDHNLVEISEVKDHPWMVGVQFHPEFQSKPNKAHPLFAAFVAAALAYRKNA